MYTTTNYRTKKALKEAVARGEQVTYYQHGIFGGNEKKDGMIAIEGPHCPEPHRWYANCTAKDGVIVKVK